MPKLKVRTLQTLPHYLELIDEFQKNAGHPLWFRGAGKIKSKLIPSLYRRAKKESSSDLQSLENKLMTRFRQRSIPYHTRNLSDDWDALFFMQHYGVPTRLLDWTENPFVGLHFALMSAPFGKTRSGKIKYRYPAAIWILNPTIWNQAALKHVSYTGEPLTPGDDALKGYAPKAATTSMNTHPVALYGAHNSARIVAQQGVFTIFGTNTVPMERLVKTGTFPAESLCCIEIPVTKIGAIRKSLLSHGITESTIYPDLEGLAKETKRHFGFED